MSVVSPVFIIIAVAAVLAMRRARGTGQRTVLLGLFSLGFVLLAMPTLGGGAALLVMATTGFVALRLVRRWKAGRVLAGCILLVLAQFVAAKQLLPQGAWHPGGPAPETLGLSYVMFRVLHLIIDAHGDELPAGLGPGRYVAYLLALPTFLAGPIQRYPDFAADLAVPVAQGDRRAVADHLRTIIRGATSYVALAGPAFLAFEASLEVILAEPAGWMLALALAAGWLSFAAYLYFGFAGYTDIMRGIAALMGLGLPANFDRPFAARNILDFWSRWHITLSEWFKLYLFNPLVKALIARTQRPKLVPYLGAFGFFVTFAVMGLWHGLGLRFLLYGLCLGAGVSLDKLLQTWLGVRLGKQRYAALTRQPAFALGARIVALAWFVLALGFLWLPRPGQMAAPPGDLLWTGLAAAGLVSTAIALTVILATSPLLSLALRFGGRLAAPATWQDAAALLLIGGFLYATGGWTAPLLYQLF